MDDAGKYKLQIGREQSARALPVLVLLLLALAAWLLFTGGLRMRDAARASNLEQARDDAVIAVKRGLADEARKFSARLASPDVAAALASGDAETAARALVMGWPEATRSAFWPVDMQVQYAALPRSGYGTLAVLEAALVAGKPVARIVRSPAGERLALAAPAPGCAAADGGLRRGSVDQDRQWPGRRIHPVRRVSRTASGRPQREGAWRSRAQ